MISSRTVIAGVSLLSVFLASCGGSKLEAKSSASALSERDQQALAMASSADPAPMESVSSPITSLEREKVVAVVDAGLGRFLQNFELEASLSEGGEFRGFRLTRIVDEQAFEGLGIGAGDIVTSINDHPIERPTEAYEAFVSLKTADSLDIDYLRGGRSMRLSLPILGDVSSQQAKTETAPKGKGSATSQSTTDKAAPNKTSK